MAASSDASIIFRWDDAQREMLTDERARELVAAIQAKGKIFASVDLSGKSFDKPAADVFAAALNALESPLSERRVDLSDCISGRHEDEAQEVLRALCAPLGENDVLKGGVVELNLSDNALGKRGVEACSVALTSQPGLERLFFNNNGLSGDAVDLIADLLISTQGEANPALTTFHIFNNMMHDEGAIALARLFSKLSANLRNVRVSTTRISSDGGVALARALANAHALEEVDVTDNSLGEEAGQIFAVGVPKMQNLRVLKIGDAGFDETGTVAVLRALQEDGAPTAIEELDLRYCDLGAESVDQLVGALRRLKSLRRLELESNDLGEPKVMRKFAPVLAELPVLEHLNLNCNGVTTRAARFLAQYVAQCPALVSLQLNENMMKAPGVEAIQQALKTAGCGDETLGSLSGNDDECESDAEDDVDDLADALANVKV